MGMVRAPRPGMKNGPPMRGPLVAACVLYLVAHGAIQGAAQTTNVSGSASVESTPAEVGYGVASVLGTLVYAPFKGAFCILGGLGSLVTLPFSTEAAGKVAGASCGGTWVITPAVVRGEEPVKFVGRSPS
jgi:hypothetical protein